MLGEESETKSFNEQIGQLSACMKLAGKYSPDLSDERHREEIERFRSSLCVLELEAEHITGKQSKFLVKEQ